MPKQTSNNHTKMPSQIAQVNIADLLALESLGARLHSYRDSRHRGRLYLSNIQDLKGKELVGVRKHTRELIEHHIVHKDEVIHLY